MNEVTGRKNSHWMWYIFPQIQRLGFSETSRYYAIKNLKEAENYLIHPLLGKRLIVICEALLEQTGDDAAKIFGNPDDLKLQSSITLFASLKKTNLVFQKVLDKFFNGSRDAKTLKIIHTNQ